MRDQLFDRIGGVGHARGMLDQRLGIAQRHGALDQGKPVHHPLARLEPAAQAERDHAAGQGHLALGQVMLGKVLSPG